MSVSRPKTKVKSKPASADHPQLDRFDLYELCVQSPEYDARMLAALHAGSGRRAPRTLAEDFCGSAAIARAWIDLNPARHSAIATDIDPMVIQNAIQRNAQRDPGDPRFQDRPRPQIQYIVQDACKVRSRADIICAFNYAVCELHSRELLLRYLRNARKRLNPSGILVLDIYAGRDAFLTDLFTKHCRSPMGEKIEYRWEQIHADPLTGMVRNAIHFRVERRGAQPLVLDNAFPYHWRLWSIPELREAMLEAGFRQTHVYPRQAEAIDDQGRFHVLPVTNPDELSESWNCYVLARL